MALMTWNNTLSVDIPTIDAQHKKLVDLINRLHDGMKEGKAREVLGPILKELADYTVMHFGVEEKFMQQHSYSGYGKQKSEHDAFVKKVSEVKRDFDSGKSSISMELMSFLKDWLSKHICIEDKQYSPFFKEKGFK